MKVLAIIPACEGSTDLPNKNMRILHGKPMVYYAIRNAKESRYITDIIVTSNSNEIITVANRMNVMIRRRTAELSSSEVSLDKVVWDVFEQLSIHEYDVVVTLQSISPLLKVETLDAAFDDFCSKGYDTLISVKNHPHFYWTHSEMKPMPMQKKRMNRHQLPSFYMETGAFLITKSCFVTEETRIGENVGLYELSGDEALDVYSFGDLKQAENAMNRLSTAIYVNGNDDIGLGHISRELQVADELFTKPVFYYDHNKTDPTSFGTTTYSLIPVNGESGLIEALKKDKPDIIINDVLNTDALFMSRLRKNVPNARIINFEDEGNGAKYADAVINALYEYAADGNSISGSRYFIISKLFLLYDPIEIKDKVKNVIVTFGGADPQNYTETVIKIAITPEFCDVHFYVIVGKVNKKAKYLDAFSTYNNLTVLHDIDNMPEIMSICDMAVSSRGRTCFELAAMGIPTLSIAQHEREAQHRFVCENNGFLCLAPDANESDIHNKLSELLRSDREWRSHLQKLMLRHDLKNGRKNVAEIIYGNKKGEY